MTEFITHRILGKMMDNLENEWTDSLWDIINESIGVDNIEDMTEEDAREIFDFAEEIEDHYPFFAMCIRNICHYWESNQEEDYVF